jgi:four helix bundle protein
MLENFRTYQLAVLLHKECKTFETLAYYIKDQLLRASSSVVLNLAEGSARSTIKDRKRFYTIAFASLREVQAIIDLEDSLTSIKASTDSLAAHLYKLTRS